MDRKFAFTSNAQEDVENELVRMSSREFSRIIVVNSQSPSVEPKMFTTKGPLYTNYECAWNNLSLAKFDCWIIEEEINDIFFTLLHLSVDKRVIYYGRDVGCLDVKVTKRPFLSPLVTFRDNFNILDRIRGDVIFYAGHRLSILIVVCNLTDLEEVRRRIRLKTVSHLTDDISDSNVVITTASHLKHHHPGRLFEVVLDQGAEMVKSRNRYDTLEDRRRLTSQEASDYTMSFAKHHYIRYNDRYSVYRDPFNYHLPFRLAYYLSGKIHNYPDIKQGASELLRFPEKEMLELAIKLPFNPRNCKILYSWFKRGLPLFPCFVILTLIECPPRGILRGKILPHLEEMLGKSNLETLLHLIIECLDTLGWNAPYPLIREWCCYYSINVDQVYPILEKLSQFSRYFLGHPIASFNHNVAINLFREFALKEYEEFIINDKLQDRFGNQFELEPRNLHSPVSKIIPLSLAAEIIWIALDV